MHNIEGWCLLYYSIVELVVLTLALVRLYIVYKGALSLLKYEIAIDQ